MKNATLPTVACAVLFAVAGPSPVGFGQSESPVPHLGERLEEAIFLHEAEADLEAAARAYEALLEEFQLVDSLAAETKYRLAICYMDQGKRELALRALSQLVEQHPQEARWVEAAKKRLPKPFRPELVPWREGERLHYHWSAPTGHQVGYSYVLYLEGERDGRPVWRQHTRALLNGDRYSMVEMDAETFRTIASEVRAPEAGLIRCAYAEDGLSAQVSYGEESDERRFTFDSLVYDNEHAYALMRQLPPEVGYAMEASVFVTMSGVHVTVRFNVTAIEIIGTPLGELECYRVDLDLPGVKQSFFFTTDERRWMTKVKVGGIEGTLVKVDEFQENQMAAYEDDEYGFRLNHPDRWVAVKRPARPESKETRLNFLDPFSQRGVALLADDNGKIQPKEALDSIDAFMDHIIKEESPRVQGEYLFDGVWREAFELDGLPAKGYRLRRPSGERGGELVRYTVVALGQKRHYLFHAYLVPEQVEENLPLFESLLASFHE